MIVLYGADTDKDPYGVIFAVMFHDNTKYGLRNVTFDTAETGASFISQAWSIKSIGTIKVNEEIYEYYLARAEKSTFNATHFRVEFFFTTSKLDDPVNGKKGKMSLTIFEGFKFKNLSTQDYQNSNLQSNRFFPHQSGFDKHKFAHAMVGDVLLAGKRLTDGTIIANNTLKINPDNLHDILRNLFTTLANDVQAAALIISVPKYYFISPESTADSNKWCYEKVDFNGFPNCIFPTHDKKSVELFF